MAQHVGPVPLQGCVRDLVNNLEDIVRQMRKDIWQLGIKELR